MTGMKRWALAVAALIAILALIFTVTPAKWYLRQNCLCGRAHFHSGEEFVIDDMLLSEIDPQEFSDEQMHVMRIRCTRHNEAVWIRIMSKSTYILQ